MGLFNRIFAKKRESPAPVPDDDEDYNLHPGCSKVIDGPPEAIRAVEMQRSYWTHNAVEQSGLEGRDTQQLNWRERLRLHHLLCLRRLGSRQERTATTKTCQEMLRQLMAFDSPYRPRPALIWQGESAQPGNDREPDLRGELLNASLTHLGCLEIYRTDAAGRPTGIDFVGFDELSGVVFARPSLLRPAKLFYEDGRSELVLAPMLYGLSWIIGNEFERAGKTTRFVAHLPGENIGTVGEPGAGVGQQDLAIRSAKGGATVFGLASVAEISFPLDLRDPKFDEKARTRGLDPVEIRRQMG